MTAKEVQGCRLADLELLGAIGAGREAEAVAAIGRPWGSSRALALAGSVGLGR